MSGRIDLMNEEIVFDLKPGREIQGRYTLQVICGCLMTGIREGAVHLYNQKKIWGIKGGGEDTWGIVVEMAKLARTIIDNQEILDHRGPTRGERYNLGKQSASCGKKIRELNAQVSKLLRPNLQLLN